MLVEAVIVDFDVEVIVSRLVSVEYRILVCVLVKVEVVVDVLSKRDVLIPIPAKRASKTITTITAIEICFILETPFQLF
jgi:hypothetical protein